MLLWVLPVYVLAFWVLVPSNVDVTVFLEESSALLAVGFEVDGVCDCDLGWDGRDELVCCRRCCGCLPLLLRLRELVPALNLLLNATSNPRLFLRCCGCCCFGLVAVSSSSS